MKIGDRVVYIEKTLPELGLINGEVYVIRNVADCGKCPDGLCIDVGIKIPHDKKFVICDTCLNIISIGEEFYLDHRGFVLFDELEEREIFINKVFQQH